jgi:hypothetical protein
MRLKLRATVCAGDCWPARCAATMAATVSLTRHLDLREGHPARASIDS